MVKLNAQQLRTQEPEPEDIKKIKKNPIYIVLDNVLDTYNIGSIFRLADATAVNKIYLCGETETPPNPRIKKASINTWKWVDWEHTETAVSALHVILNSFQDPNKIPKQDGYQTVTRQVRDNKRPLQVIAVEQHSKSISLHKLKPEFPVAVVVGNETFGVSEEVLKMADTIVELPMYGINKSLNVMVSCGIVLYKIMEFL